ncbi:hypothetical protein PV326_007519, partial [Microctonus aethiopoides]
DWYIGPVVGTHIAIGGVNIGRCLCVESIEVLAIIQAAGGYAIADDEDDNDDAAGDGGVADHELSGCLTDMAEGSAEEEQSSTAAPASPPADLRTLNTHLSSSSSSSSPYHHRRLQPQQLHPRQHSNMLATAVPLRDSYSMLSHHVKRETVDIDGPCDVPLNLKSEILSE